MTAADEHHNSPPPRPNLPDPRAAQLNYSTLSPPRTGKLRDAWPLTGAFWFGAWSFGFLIALLGLLSEGPPHANAELAMVVAVFGASSALAAISSIPFAITITRAIYPLDRRPIRRYRSLTMIGGAAVPVLLGFCILLDRFLPRFISVLAPCGILLSIAIYPFLFALWIGPRAE